MYSFIL